jgi:major capsid protein E
MGQSILDVFNGDAYGVQNLTLGAEGFQFQPGRLGASGLFKTEGVTTWVVAIEKRKNKLALIPTKARDSGATTALPPAAEKIYPFVVPHLPHNTALMAADVQGVRAFGSADRLRGVNEILQGKIEGLRQNHEVTHEYHRVGAIQGHVKDADGIATIVNLFTEFTITEKVVDFDLDTAGTDVKAKCELVRAHLRTTLGGRTMRGVSAQCGVSFWNKLISHPSVVSAWEIWQEGRFLRDPVRSNNLADTDVFDFAGIRFSPYEGSVGDVDFIPSTVCRCYPEGVQGLFVQYFGPANFVETVNTIGKPFYVKQMRMDFDMGIKIHSQSNPCVLCTEPEMLVKGTE